MLPIVAILAGILTTIVIRRTTDVRALRETRKRIYARILEFRLFFDEPGLIWQAQIGLVGENLRLVQLLLVPTLILALPMAWVVMQLDAAYGLRPLRQGEAAVVTAQLTRHPEAQDRFDLQGIGGVVVETPPVRVFHDDRVAWRIRPVRDGDGAIVLTVNGRHTAHMVLSVRRSRSRVEDRDVGWLEVEYPEGTRIWMVWFAVVSSGAALMCARWMRNQVD
jgi:hypothetical protein